MALSLNDLAQKIYFEDSGTLAHRIDYAWKVYSQQHSFSITDENRKNALAFLIYAFDIQNFNDINKQLISLMNDRNKYKGYNPEYIPGKSPKHLNLSQEHAYSYSLIEKIALAVHQKELLNVNDESKQLDNERETLMFDSETRSKQRVHINQGLFLKDGYLFDTSEMISHKKTGYAAYTLNIHGELSVFNHKGMEDRIAHSSMNSGAPVIAAGELKITNGQLKAITTHSGHYHPSLFNVYRVLEYFTDNDVDISETKINLLSDPKASLPTINCQEKFFDAYQKNLYITDASKIYTNVKKIIHHSVKSIKADIKAYQADKFTTMIYRAKDMIIGSDLTKQRNQLANEFEQAIKQFKKDMIGILPEQLSLKIRTLSKLIDTIEKENNKLSYNANKPKNTGRLAQKIIFFKQEINDLSKKTNTIDNYDSAAMKKIR